MERHVTLAKDIFFSFLFSFCVVSCTVVVCFCYVNVVNIYTQ